MSNQREATKQAIGVLAAAGVAGGTLVGTGMITFGLAPGAGLATLELSAPELPSAAIAWAGRGALAKQIGPQQVQLLRRLFDSRIKGLARKPSIPEGLTRKAVEQYAEIAKRTIAAGKDPSGEQAVRLKICEELLRIMK